MSKRRIAILITLLFAAPAAVVALEQSASEAMQPGQEIQAAEPAATTEAVVVTEQTTVVAVAEQQPAPVSDRPSAFGNWRGTVASSTFPQGSTDSDDAWRYHSPRQLAYLERLEQQRGTMIALGSSFPAGTNGDEAGAYQPLPAQVAYFNRAEQQRMASIPAQPIASSDVQARSSEESAQAGSAELAMNSLR